MELTTRELWDDMWDSVTLPVRVDISDPYIGPIISTMSSHIPPTAQTIAEVGGAPGGYLAFFADRGLIPVALERSSVGCDKTQENWDLLGVAGEVIQCDMFTSRPLNRYDVVYSLGLIEHFDDLDYVVSHHLKYLKPGGILILGCPNFRGVYTRPMRWLSPERLRIHNLGVMDFASWGGFEESLGLTRLFRGYVGGFEPKLFARAEGSGRIPHCMGLGARGLSRFLRLPVVRAVHSVNHSAISGYLLGVYRTSTVNRDVPKQFSGSARGLTQR